MAINNLFQMTWSRQNLDLVTFPLCSCWRHVAIPIALCRPEKPARTGSVEEGSSSSQRGEHLGSTNSPRGEHRQRNKSCTKHALEREMRHAAKETINKEGREVNEPLADSSGGRREPVSDSTRLRETSSRETLRETCSAGSRRSSHSHGRKLSRWENLLFLGSLERLVLVR